MSEEKAEVTYRYLEARPHPWRKQLCIKGRNLTVWQLLTSMCGERRDARRSRPQPRASCGSRL
jgi:hypothetical protein